jgi:hypothetical protein
VNVTYGANYSVLELSPSELDRFTGQEIRFLAPNMRAWKGRCSSSRPRPLPMTLACPERRTAQVTGIRLIVPG